MIESLDDDHVVAQSKSATQGEATRVSTTVSHDGPKQLTTIREAATLVLTLTGANFLAVRFPFSVIIVSLLRFEYRHFRPKQL